MKFIKLRYLWEPSMGETIIKKDLTGEWIPIFSADSTWLPWWYTTKNRKFFKRWTLVISARWTIWYINLPEFEVFSCTQTTINFIPDETKIIPKYLLYALKKVNFKSITKWVGIPMLTISDLVEVEIPVPSIEDQKNIIKKLDKIVHLIELKEQSIRKTEELTKTIFLEMFGDLTLNEKMWNMVNMKDICYKITDWTHQSPKFTSEGIPFIFVQNMVKGSIDFSSTKFVSRETYVNLTRNTKIEKDDIIYSSVWSFGVAVQVLSEKEFIFQRHIAHLKPDRSKVLPSFLTFQMNTDFIFSQAKKIARWAAQPTINLWDIRLFKVALPELRLQKKFVNIFEKNQTVIENQKQSLIKL